MLNFCLTQDQLELQQDGRVSASISKLYATETALEVVNEALQIFGGYGYTKMFPVEKLLREVRLLRIYETPINSTNYPGGLSAQRISTPLLKDLPLHREHDPYDGQKASIILKHQEERRFD